MTLIFAFGICFQMPVILTLLGKAGIIDSQFLVEKRRYAIVIVFVIAAVLTPPDVISQLALALPTLLLYEASIFSVRMVEKKRTPGARGRRGGGVIAKHAPLADIARRCHPGRSRSANPSPSTRGGPTRSARCSWVPGSSLRSAPE